MSSAATSKPVSSDQGPQATLRGMAFDLSAIDLSQILVDKAGIARVIPHRTEMALLDAIVWHDAELSRGVAVKVVRDDEFWVSGHFPGRPLMPGVLQVEAGAQLAVFLYNTRCGKTLTAAFTRIENCSFRNMVVPGDRLYLLCQEIKWTRRGFVCRVQGVANQKITFDAEIHGLAV